MHIHENVLHGAPLDPYFEVLDHLRDAIGNVGDPRAAIEGDWDAAIRAALDHTQIWSWGALHRERVQARDFKVAKLARDLRDAGFAIRLEPGRLNALSPAPEAGRSAGRKAAEKAGVTVERVVAEVAKIGIGFSSPDDKLTASRLSEVADPSNIVVGSASRSFSASWSSRAPRKPPRHPADKVLVSRPDNTILMSQLAVASCSQRCARGPTRTRLVRRGEAGKRRMNATVSFGSDGRSARPV